MKNKQGRREAEVWDACDELLAQGSKLIIDYEILNEQEYHLMVDEWNATEETFPMDKTIQQCFEEQVARTPNNTALIFRVL